MCLQFGFVIFWPKDLGAKAANKMLVKLTSGGSVVLAHVLQLLFIEKNHKIINNSTATDDCFVKRVNNMFNRKTSWSKRGGQLYWARDILRNGKAQYGWPLVPTSLDELVFHLKFFFTFLTKQANLMRRSTVLGLPPQLIFPDWAFCYRLPWIQLWQGKTQSTVDLLIIIACFVKS